MKKNNLLIFFFTMMPLLILAEASKNNGKLIKAPVDQKIPEIQLPVYNSDLDTDNPYILDHSDDIEKKLEQWSLEQIETYAVSNNPLYLAEKKNIGMARGDVITASLWRNPVISYQNQFLPVHNTNVPSQYLPTISTGGLGIVPLPHGSSGGPIEIAPGISQDIDVGGVIEQRTKVAKHAFQAQIASFEDFDRLFRLRLRQNYWLYLYIAELVDFQKEFYENYNDLLQLTKFRAEKGDISPLEYDRILIESIRIEKEYRDSEILRAQVAKEVRFLIGISPKNSILVLKGDLKYKSASELGIQISEANIENRPDLKVAQIRTAQSKLNIDLQKKEGGLFGPFVSVGGEIRQKGSETYGGVFVSVPLKVFDQNQGQIIKAEEQYKKSLLELESKRKQIYAEIRAAVKELVARENVLKTYQKINLLEKNKEVQEKYRFAYTRGASNLVTFLEAEKNFLTVRRGYFEQIYLYYNAIEVYRAAIGKLGDIK